MIRQIYSVRGATTVDADERAGIAERSVELVKKMIEANGIDGENVRVTDYIVGSTADITAFYPARAIRESGVVDAPVFSTLEPPITGSLPLCIRVLMRVASSDEKKKTPVHVYLHGARALRPDLAAGSLKEDDK